MSIRLSSRFGASDAAPELDRPMKLATYRDGSRDGQLVIVSRDLASAHYASAVASRLQQVLDDWNFLSPQLEDVSARLNDGKARHAFAFEPSRCLAPLPRAYQWACDAAADSKGEPLLVQGGSGHFLGPHDDVVVAHADRGIAVTARVAVLTGDVATSASPEAALDAVRLVVLAADIGVRNAEPTEPDAAFDPTIHSSAVAFAPIAVTPDELGPAWHGGRLHLDLEVARNGQAAVVGPVASAMRFDFGELVARLCATRQATAGTIVGSGALSAVLPAAALCPGDAIRIEIRSASGASVFGAIAQRFVAAASGAEPRRP